MRSYDDQDDRKMKKRRKKRSKVHPGYGNLQEDSGLSNEGFEMGEKKKHTLKKLEDEEESEEEMSQFHRQCCAEPQTFGVKRHVLSVSLLSKLKVEGRNVWKDLLQTREMEQQVESRGRKKIKEVLKAANVFSAAQAVQEAVSKWRNYNTSRRHVQENKTVYAVKKKPELEGLASDLDDDVEDDQIDAALGFPGLGDTAAKRKASASNRAFISYFAKLGKVDGSDDFVDLDFLENLIDNGANVNSTDRYGQSVLHEVARAWHIDVAKFLLGKGMDPNQKDVYGRTALHVAAAVNYPEMVEFLVQHGESFKKVAGEAADSLAKTPMEVAVQYKQYEVLQHPVFQKLISMKWKGFARRGAWLSLFLNFIFIVMWTTLAVAPAWEVRHTYTFPQDWWRIIVSSIAVLLTFYHIIVELKEFFSDKQKFQAWQKWRTAEIRKDLTFCHPRWPEERAFLLREIDQIQDQKSSYFSDFWNLFDWTLYLLLLVCITTHIVDVFAHSKELARWHIRIFALTIIIMWLRLMKNARAFRAIEDEIFADLLLAMFFFVSAILCINLFIALLSDTFQRVYDNAVSNAIMQQAQTILGLEASMSKKKREKFKAMIHSQCAPLPEYYDDDMTSAEGDDLQKITFQIMDEGTSSDQPRPIRPVYPASTDSGLSDSHRSSGAMVSQVQEEVKTLRDEISNLRLRQDEMFDRMRHDNSSMKRFLQHLIDIQSQGGFQPRGGGGGGESSMGVRGPSRLEPLSVGDHGRGDRMRGSPRSSPLAREVRDDSPYGVRDRDVEKGLPESRQSHRTSSRQRREQELERRDLSDTPSNDVSPGSDDGPDGDMHAHMAGGDAWQPPQDVRIKSTVRNSRQPPYVMDAGALIIQRPEKTKDEGVYQCVAENDYGKVISRQANLTFAYSDPFAETPRPPVSGSEGEGAVLRCQKPDAYPGLMFFWVESGSLDPAFAVTNQRVYVSQKTGDLYFARAEPNDPGDYQLLLSEDELVAARHFIKPDDVIFDPFSPTPEVTLPCNSTGEQPLTYSWRKDGQLLDLNSRQPPYVMDAGALIIQRPEKTKDEGVYQCVAENDYGKVISRQANLTFAYSDPFAETPRPPVSGSEGEGAVLRCQKPDAYPGLMFFWVESGSLDPAFAVTNQRVYVSQKTGDLYFARAEPNDPGDYQCVLRLSVDPTSPLRHLSPTVSFSVADQSPPQSAPNLVLHEGDSISSVIHVVVLMEGFAYGNPIPTLTWRRLDAQGNEVAMPPANRLAMETWNRALTISNVQREDAGFYEVTATNSLGTQSQITQLFVNVGPQFSKSLSDQNHRLDLGESVTWDVAWDVGDTTDPVDVVWLHNAEILTEGGRYRMTQSGNTASLQITDLTEEDSGAYQCSISNLYGRTRSSAELHSGAPSYVRNIRLTDSGDDYAVLDWDPPLGYDGDDIGGYQVQAIPKSGGDTRTIDVGPAETTARIDGLNGDSGGYTYRVRARSTGGTWGPWTTFREDQGGSGARTAESTSQLLTWLLPLLIVLLLLLILLCCCCCLWLGLCGKYCPCCTCWTCFERTESKHYKAMRRDHQEMLKLYRLDAVTHVQNPDRITAFLASRKVRLPTGMSPIKKPRTREDRNKVLLDNLTFGEDDAFEGYCAALREEEKLYWLADTLEGSGLSVDLREQLMRHQTVLVEKMDPDITLAHLSKQKVFTDAMSDYVSSADSREEKNRRIVHLLQSRDDPDFFTFCGALRQNQSQAHLADLLQARKCRLKRVRHPGLTHSYYVYFIDIRHCHCQISLSGTLTRVGSPRLPAPGRAVPETSLIFTVYKPPADVTIEPVVSEPHINIPALIHPHADHTVRYYGVHFQKMTYGACVRSSCPIYTGQKDYLSQCVDGRAVRVL
uniref:Uncharacterized protein n=1 Tax=Branchiostoma floridae TaxID=7739 RepID=C3Y1F2_BRAFL|eukprot:XP_002609682.1 hypothetical protein BRAFLDRAFT_123581 [Branchiostoma floridae]